MTFLAPRPDLVRRRPARAPLGRRLLLPVTLARPLAFGALACWGALHWARMVQPAVPGALLAAVAAGLAGGAALIVLAQRRAPARVRVLATLLVAAVLLVMALVIAGVPRGLFAPRALDDLAEGIYQGVGTVPTVRVPYSGLEEWTRLVIILGGAALVGLAALLAFVPRRDGAFGFPLPAAFALGVLYTVPVMQHEIVRPFLAGVAFALLLALFLWLERIERASLGLAIAVVAAAALAGLVAAPRVDGDRALLDYEELAQSLSPAAGTQYSWNHSYGPLDWPRDGREVLRVRSRERAYWKAANLTGFDGVRWIQAGQHEVAGADTPDVRREWVQRIEVTLRALRSSQFVATGTTFDILDSSREAVESTPGVFETAGRSLRRGHAYRAVVYSPRPTQRELRAAGTGYPQQLATDYGFIGLPFFSAGGRFVDLPFWGDASADATERRAAAARELAATPYARAYELAQRLRAQSATPYDFVRGVERHLARGFEYDEAPPRSNVPLEDFLFRDRVGYCQQFSGAMALLLRMGGVPARVAAGFSPGVADAERREWVVRDIDAHSWVEVYFPRIGWVTRDPTPAASPARSQVTDVVGGGGDAQVALAGASERGLGGNTDTGPAAVQATGSEEPGSSHAWVLLAAIGAALALGLVAVVAGVRRRGRRRRSGGNADDDAAEEVAELLRALRRCGRPPAPHTTLERLASGFSGTPAEPYVRELVSARYGFGGAERPTPEQRAGLRRELAAHGGLRGRLRALWALPPRPRGRRGARSRARR